ncbi:MAG TPA: electron transfer flavoprotein beta subunit/FixA family protein [Chlorobaculum sp.]|uniref:Electron transfer flavoprotein subunit beta n=1 Tax=Chlorobaculum tepidum (strain ATCC 49652 / DSM 12025 / NBRC 103806 / TLS) TaxID=194439 RepID=Q8KAL4_CHLTE|nr:electron transfer flavoprotein, beta subunit [Chlorobaculum tepidum TLS]HBU23473.1 electron transfer flavoprotein beta subunit/FixA family protein [Chlorobaculum sp.]
MNILVCVKQVPDMEGHFISNSSGSWFDEAGLAWRMNEYDTFAVEEAIRLKEQLGGEARVTVLSVGPARVVETIRKALSTGCDDGVHIVDPEAPERDPWQIASMIAGFAVGRGFDLIFTGMQSEDRGSAQVGVLVAERLGIASVTGITAFEWQDGAMTVERELEGGRRCRLRLKAPALMTCQLGLNSPRYPTLPNIMKSKRTMLTVLSPESVGLESPKVLSCNFRPHEPNGAGVILEGDAGAMAARVLEILEAKGLVSGKGGAR